MSQQAKKSRPRACSRAALLINRSLPASTAGLVCLFVAMVVTVFTVMTFRHHLLEFFDRFVRVGYESSRPRPDRSR